jgi:thiol:disulfide interchange protein DsbD
MTDLTGVSLNSKQPTISFVNIDEYESWLKEGLSNFKK